MPINVWACHPRASAARLRRIGNVAFVIGMALWLFVAPTSFYPVPVHALSGFFLGIAITTYLWGLVLRRIGR